MGSIPIARSNTFNGLERPNPAPQIGVSAECPRNPFPSRSGQDDLLAQEVVRGQPVAATSHQASSKVLNDPAHPSNQLVAQLNERWRVVDDPLQWKLQRKKGNARKRNSGWQDRSFCRTRDGLLRCVCEYCGEVEPAALAKLSVLPQYHPDEDVSLRGLGHAATSAAARS